MKLIAENAVAQIAPECGGRLASFTIDGEEILVTSGGSATEWGCYPMAPWAGRVAEGRFSWKGRPIQLPITCGPHALHGTVLDRPWSRCGEAALEIDFGPDWPWKGSIRSDFELQAGVFRWTLTVSALDEPMPVFLGWHPWFLRSRGPATKLDLTFDPRAMYERDSNGIPTGQRIAPSTGPWDDCFGDVSHPPRLRWSDGLTLDVNSSCTYWVIYDEPRHALCVEPQSAPPDAFNLGNATVVDPDCPMTHTMEWRWSTQD